MKTKTANRSLEGKLMLIVRKSSEQPRVDAHGQTAKTTSQLHSHHNMDTNTINYMDGERLKDLCKASYPVLESIMSSLTATDVSVFLYTFSLTNSVPTKARKRYMNIHRDLPGYEDWIEDVQSKGDTVLIAGTDINKLLDRYRDPVTYWIKNEYPDKCRIWIMAVCSISYAAVTRRPFKFPESFNASEFHKYGFSESRELGRMDMINHATTGSCEGTFCNSLLPMTRVLVPGPGRWPKCCMEWYRQTTLHYEPRTTNNTKTLSVQTVDWMIGTILEVDRFKRQSPIDVTGMIKDEYSLTYMNLNNDVLRHSIASWDPDEFIYKYIDTDGHIISSITESVDQRYIMVDYKPRDISSDKCEFRILFE